MRIDGGWNDQCGNCQNIIYQRYYGIHAPEMTRCSAQFENVMLRESLT